MHHLITQQEVTRFLENISYQEYENKNIFKYFYSFFCVASASPRIGNPSFPRRVPGSNMDRIIYCFSQILCSEFSLKICVGIQLTATPWLMEIEQVLWEWVSKGLISWLLVGDWLSSFDALDPQNDWNLCSRIISPKVPPENWQYFLLYSC